MANIKKNTAFIIYEVNYNNLKSRMRYYFHHCIPISLFKVMISQVVNYW